MRKIAKSLPSGSTGSLLLWRDCLNEFFKCAVRYGESGEWIKSKNALHEMYEPFEELRIGLRKTPSTAYSLVEELENLEESYKYEMARAESAQHLSVARKALNNLFFEQENLEMDLVWFVMDELKAATLTASELSCESEAAALSWQGVLYFKVLKMDDMAQKLLKDAVRVAMAITQTTGKIFHHEDWYKNASDTLGEIQKKVVQKEEASIEKILVELRPEIEAMKAALKEFESRNLRSLSLLRHVYEKHPPKNGAKMSDELNAKEVSNHTVKKGLRAAVTHYHTDRPFNKKCDIKWRTLCELICKEVNALYSDFKGVPLEESSDDKN
jgi:hypothetical protein